MRPAAGRFTHPRGTQRRPWLAAQGDRERGSHGQREYLKMLAPLAPCSKRAARALLALPEVPGDAMVRWKAQRRLEPR